MSKEHRFALIGENIGYSLSPRIFNTIFRQLGVAGEFYLKSVNRSELSYQLKSIVAEGIRGIAVTIPHKEAVRHLLDREDQSARGVGAVNSILIENNRLTGYNTDLIGFTHGLDRAGVTAIDGPVVIAGSGGAARAAIWALATQFGISEFTVMSRTPASLDNLKCHFNASAIDITIAAYKGWPGVAGLFVNCTPLGGPNYTDLSPLPRETAWSEVDLYYDLNYNTDNRAARSARQAGVKTVDGTAMLVAQALESFRLWTGRGVEFEPVYTEVFPH